MLLYPLKQAPRRLNFPGFLALQQAHPRFHARDGGGSMRSLIVTYYPLDL